MVHLAMRAAAAAGAAAMIAAVAGCAAPSVTAPAPPSTPATNPNQPVNLVFYNMANASDQSVTDRFINPVKSKFPNYTIDYVKNGKGTSLDELVTAGKIPDVIYVTTSEMSQIRLKQAGTDLTPLIQQFKYDLSRFDDGVIDTIKSLSGNNQILGLPLSNNPAVLYYNKDIFDKFGVPYPKDGMTWDETYELAKKVTKNESAIQYRGFDFNISYVLNQNPLSAPIVDGAAAKAALTQDKWKTLLANFSRFYDIPGNKLTADLPDDTKQFVEKRTLAMRAGNLLISDLRDAQMNWDVVTLPSFSEARGIGS